MEFIDKNKIKTNKILNELDEFVLKFIKILEKHARYVIVSGYVSIFFGRSRATEDIDIIVEKLDKGSFIRLYGELIKNNFWCLNSSNVDEIYEYLEEHAVRFAITDRVLPNIEFKFAKTESDKEALRETITVETTEGKLVMGNIEMQIAFKRYILSSEKDIEDAVHLEEVFKGKLNSERLKRYEEWFKK